MSDRDSLFTAVRVVALLDVERDRSAALAADLYDANAKVRRLRNLADAYSLLGRDLGFTEADARERWKKAGYGGL